MRDWDIRPAIGTDLHYIYSAWLYSYRHESKIGRSTRKIIYFREYCSVIDSILSKEDTQVLIACSIDDKDVILGFLVSEYSHAINSTPILHYVFVKEPFRNNKIARSLFEKCFGAGGDIYYTHATNDGIHALASRGGFIYNPFLLFKRGKSNP